MCRPPARTILAPIPVKRLAACHHPKKGVVNSRDKRVAFETKANTETLVRF